MHFGTENLEEVRARLVSEGVNPSTIEPFQRTVEIPGGSAVMRARRLSFAPGDNPEALFQIVEHDTPELVLQPRYMAHPNGAQTLTEVILCVDDPKKAATRYASYAGHRAARLGDLFVIDLGEARLLIVDPSGLTSVLPGDIRRCCPISPHLRSRAISQTAAYLRQREIPSVNHGRRILVGAREAGGSAVIFETLGAAR